MSYALQGRSRFWFRRWRSAPSVSVSAENWPQFRGPNGRGISTETVPLEWSSDANKNIAWKAPIPGRGLSEPIVWGDRIFLTTAVEGAAVAGASAVKHIDEGKEFLHPDSVGADKQHTLKVFALEARSGKVLWEQTAWEGTPWDNRHRRSSFAAPTPVTDGTLVFTWFGPSGLYAYDFSGTLVWKKTLEGPATLGLGTGTSPVLHGNLLILLCDEDSGEKSFIVALDKRDGREVWRTARKVQVSWATPVIVNANGRDELVTSGSELIVAYDPATGKELWRTTGVQSNAIPSPVVRSRDGVSLDGISGEESDRRAPRSERRPHRHAQHRLDVSQGNGVRVVADSRRRLPVHHERPGRDHVPGRQDREGALRRRPAARAGALHGVDGRRRRQDPADERGGGHLRGAGGPETRGAREEFHR